MKQLTFPDGREVSYELTRKRVKNVNLRVQTDGTLHISANARVPISEIERFILANESFIISAAERLQQREQRSEVSVESVHWLGREYPVRVIVNSRECAILEEDELRVFTRAQTPEEAEEIVRRWLSDRFMELIRELNAEVLRGLSEGGLTPPKTRITIKDMSTRWGSCSYSRGHISINSRLAAYPRETVLSVLWHEYAHYWHHDHSPRFYAFVERFYPEYRKWNALLK